MAELIPCDRDPLARNAKNIYYLALYRKVPNPELVCWALFQAFLYIHSINPPAALGGGGGKPREVKKRTQGHPGSVELSCHSTQGP